ncbi:DNA-binding protein [Candidatus Gracilibacteria bacterium]|jgi:hypothetical protein|nr:DNA-binding protein [Candidatus Gracilibacteria bacterium]
MKSKKLTNGYILRLEKGEEIITSLTKFCEDNDIKSGSISGVGGTDDVSVKYYDPEQEKYISKKFTSKNFEIISLNGNISLVDGKPFPHVHIMLGDADYNTFGGHLGSANIAITCEIVIQMTDYIFTRKLDEEFNLNFLEF